jgi:hypothetical protein
MKTSYQEEIDINNEPVEVKREEPLEDPYSQDGTRKVLTVSIAANQVTLKETVDSRSKETLITNKDKDHRVPGKGILKKNYYAARSIVDDRSVAETRTPQQKAQDWLSGVAEEEDEVKDLVMQQLWKREDFQNV